MNPIAKKLFALAHQLNRPKTTEQLVLDCLADGRLSGSELALIGHGRRGEVFAACRQLAAAGRIRRVGAKWEVV